MSDHVPATLQFSNLSYTASSKAILSSITGSVSPGQIMAIMGASGAGKSTLLDILARKSKRGVVGGEIFVNGRNISGEENGGGEEWKRVVGFVDQEDTLMSTLTVYETVLYSALLRLPRDMSLEAKKFRTLETMQELGILGIKDSRIGESGEFSARQNLLHRLAVAESPPSPLQQVGDRSREERSVEFPSPVNSSRLPQFCFSMSPHLVSRSTLILQPPT